jgi:hypothetical protein
LPLPKAPVITPEAPAGITGPRSPRDRAGPLGFKVLCLEGTCCRTC